MNSSLSRLLAIPALLFSTGLFALAAPPPEPVEMSLLHTIYVGAPVGLSAAEISAAAADKEGGYGKNLLAVAALRVIGRDAPSEQWPLDRLLDNALSRLQRRSGMYQMPSGVPEGFGGKELIFALVHALATTGRAGEAETVLAKYLTPERDFAAAVSLQALRQIGDANADRLLRKAADEAKGSNLAENLLADHYLPFLTEPQLKSIRPDQRDRAHLLEATGENCTEAQAAALYTLGFYPFAADPAQNEAELKRLRELAWSSCYCTAFMATRALALRSPESPDFWVRLFDHAPDAWMRDLIAQIGFIRFPVEFPRRALTLLEKEPVQYVQWELMHGNLERRSGRRFRTLWDLWNPVTLQFHLDFEEEGDGVLPRRDAAELLSWLEQGNRPRDEWVHHHLLYGLAKSVSGAEATRLVRVFGALPEHAAHYWILTPLEEPAVLPQLRQWAAQPAPGDQLEQLNPLIVKLEAKLPKAPKVTGEQR